MALLLHNEILLYLNGFRVKIKETVMTYAQKMKGDI